ncbi:MAG: hypothetical protein JXR59_05510 [Desulfuromonadaceae bacterium]|nr:hypothetical protein [Desulfuromonadaceae bacterium]
MKRPANLLTWALKWAVIILFTLSLTGCETLHGLGRDFEGFGRWIQECCE